MSIFQPSGDPAYLAWLDANRNGYPSDLAGIARWHAQGQHTRTLLVVVATGARPWS